MPHMPCTCSPRGRPDRSHGDTTWFPRGVHVVTSTRDQTGLTFSSLTGLRIRAACLELLTGSLLGFLKEVELKSGLDFESM